MQNPLCQGGESIGVIGRGLGSERGVKFCLYPGALEKNDKMACPFQSQPPSQIGLQNGQGIVDSSADPG